MAFQLKYHTYQSTDDYSISVDIRLSDDCKNGHADFAITGDYHDYVNRGHCCGCIHDVILPLFPQFKPFIDLHLCDAKGAPMYAQANGFYHLRNSPKELTMKELRITETEYDCFYREAEDQLYFTYLLQIMGIPERWEKEARAAIAQLEELTGDTFVDDSRRYQFTPLTAEELSLVETRIAEGYYTPANIRKRAKEARRQANLKEINDLKNSARKQKESIDRELSLKLYLMRLNMPLDNFIYYDHTNKGVFNWLERSLRKQLTQEEFDRFLKKVDYSKLPEGITFELKSA